jgi:hypothetical protein
MRFIDPTSRDREVKGRESKVSLAKRERSTEENTDSSEKERPLTFIEKEYV